MTPPTPGALKLRPPHVPQSSQSRFCSQLRKLDPPPASAVLVPGRDPAILVFTMDAGALAWTVRGPASSPRRVVSPLADERFRWLVASLREWACRPVPHGRCDPLRIAAFAEDRARRVSARLTRALLTAEDQRVVALAMAANGQTELAVRVRSAEGTAGDEVLALPWELLAPELPGRFPVRDGRLTILREAISASTPSAALERAGCAQVMALFNPGDAELGARLEARFQSVLAAGGSVQEAAGAARALLSEPLGRDGARHYLPFGWSQLAVFQSDAAGRILRGKTVRIG